MAGMAHMRDQLKASIETERERAAEMSRVNNALNVVTSNVMIADANNVIVYLNESAENMFSAAQTDIRKDLPSFTVDKRSARISTISTRIQRTKETCSEG